MPWTVPAMIAIWSVVELVNWIREQQPRPFRSQEPTGIEFSIAELLHLVYALLIVALVGIGLLKGLRFAWVTALVWQTLRLGLGITIFAANGYAIDWLYSGGTIQLYGITIPIVTAVVSFVLLLLPTTRRWVRET